MIGFMAPPAQTPNAVLTRLSGATKASHSFFHGLIPRYWRFIHSFFTERFRGFCYIARLRGVLVP
jgi:hypothetical protein